jgi:hypothetical protein
VYQVFKEFSKFIIYVNHWLSAPGFLVWFKLGMSILLGRLSQIIRGYSQMRVENS